MTNFEWCKAICRVDPKELEDWMKEHPSQLGFLGLSTGRDNYGLVGKSGKKAKTVNHFQVGALIAGRL